MKKYQEPYYDYLVSLLDKDFDVIHKKYEKDKNRETYFLNFHIGMPIEFQYVKIEFPKHGLGPIEDYYLIGKMSKNSRAFLYTRLTMSSGHELQFGEAPLELEPNTELWQYTCFWTSGGYQIHYKLKEMYDKIKEKQELEQSQHQDKGENV